MSEFSECPVCKGAITETPHLKLPYTIISCVECGNYSLHDSAVAELRANPDIAPDPEVFRTWLAKEKVQPSLESQGPLITAGSFKLIRKRLH